jgi:uncharacterized protein (DUF342 family)
LTAAISVEIAADRMSASIAVKAPKKGAAPPTLDDLLAELRRAGVVYGIDRDAMNILISKSLYEKPVPAAAGTVPVFGRAHRIVYRFNVNRGRPYLEMDFGRINLKELNFIDNCRTGDLLAELEMPILAVDGRTVTGETIPAQTDSQIVPLVPGTNTLLSPDRTQLYAQCDGNVKLVDGAVLVEPVIIVKNVNYETRISASMAPWSWKAASPMASSLKPVEIFKSETASARLFSRRREIYS